MYNFVLLCTCIVYASISIFLYFLYRCISIFSNILRYECNFYILVHCIGTFLYLCILFEVLYVVYNFVYFFRVVVITRFPLYLYMIGWINTYQSVQLTYVNKRFSFDAIFPQKWCSFSLIYFSFMSNNEEKGELCLKFLACYLPVIRTKSKKTAGTRKC